MVKICDSANFIVTIFLTTYSQKIEIAKYNHDHQSFFVDISYCDINIIYLLRSISYDILCNDFYLFDTCEAVQKHGNCDYLFWTGGS